MEVTSYTTLTASTTLQLEAAMGIYVFESGTLSVCLSADTWSSYDPSSTGDYILTYCGDDDDDSTYLDHCAQIVGINNEADTPYWIVSSLHLIYL